MLRAKVVDSKFRIDTDSDGFRIWPERDLDIEMTPFRIRKMTDQEMMDAIGHRRYRLYVVVWSLGDFSPPVGTVATRRMFRKSCPNAGFRIVKSDRGKCWPIAGY